MSTMRGYQRGQTEATTYSTSGAAKMWCVRPTALSVSWRPNFTDMNGALAAVSEMELGQLLDAVAHLVAT